MSTSRNLLVALGLAALGTIAPVGASGASAGANCAFQYNTHTGDGNFRAYEALDCSLLLGSPASGNDYNWADSTGPFRGASGVNDNAESVLNTGTYAGGVNTVKLYKNASLNGSAPASPYTCLAWNELYADNLFDNTFTDGTAVANKISAHAWVTSSACAKFVT